MTLVEVLEKLEEGQLQNLVWWWGNVVPEEKESHYVRRKEPYALWLFNRNVDDLSKAECIEYLSQRVASLDEATSVRALNKIQSTQVQIRSGNIPSALALCWLSEETLRRIATELNIDVSNPPPTSIEGHIKSAFATYRNSHKESHWYIVGKISAALTHGNYDSTKQPVKSRETPIQPAPTQPQQPNNLDEIFHYIGAAILGFFATGLLAMVFTGGVPGLTGVAGILGAVGAAFLTKMYKDSQQGQSTPAPRIESPPQVVEPPPPTPIMEPPPPTPSGTSAICPECGDTSPDEATHCISCGNKLPELICPNCQTENISRAKFCMGCGQQR